MDSQDCAIDRWRLVLENADASVLRRRSEEGDSPGMFKSDIVLPASRRVGKIRSAAERAEEQEVDAVAASEGECVV